MDFELYTQEEDSFREEVRAWLEENLQDGLRLPERMEHVADQALLWEFQRRLADKGWAAPTWPKEWGGSELPLAQAAIIEEELQASDCPVMPGAIGRRLVAPAIWVWGTEDQKKRFIRPLVRGEYNVFQLFTEPGAGSDLASLQTRAGKNGDDFIIDGHKTFVGNAYDPEWFWLLGVTDPEAPRHHNLGAFFFPADLPGVTVDMLDLMTTEVKRVVYLDNVRVSREYLIGGETEGWGVSQTTLEMEHGGGGGVVDLVRRIGQLIEYARNTTVNGQPLSQRPHVQRALVDLYIEGQITRLMGLRNQWMHHAKETMAHHGSQFTLLRKQLSFTLAQAILETAGPYSSLTDSDVVPYDAVFEYRFREAITGAHPAGTLEIHKLIMARRLGLGKKAEQAAPTPAF